METFYHGSSVLFDRFDLSHALEGDGKVKFGYGVYVTEKYESAAHYAFNSQRPENTDYYVYTVEIPSMTDDNYIFSCRPVQPAIVQRAEEKLGECIPEEVQTAGKLFRKYIGNKVLGRKGTVKQLMGKADLEAEKAAAQFLGTIGLDFFVWPQSQANPDGLTNRAVIDDTQVKIVRVDKVELDKKLQLIPGSQKQIR